MRALLLSGGKGERLRPLTLTTPKPLLEVGGRPLIHYPLLMLRRAGITEVAINVHHLPGEFELKLGSGASLGMRITYAPEPMLLGTGAPLLALRDFFGEESFFVVNADSISDIDIRAMAQFHRDTGSLVTIALNSPLNLGDYSRLEVDAQRRIRRMRLLQKGGGFRDFPGELDEAVGRTLEAYMYCGVYVCEPAVFDRMPPAPPFSSMGDVFAPMVAEGLPLFGYIYRGLFRTLDDLGSYHAVRVEFERTPPRLNYLQS